MEREIQRLVASYLNCNEAEVGVIRGFNATLILVRPASEAEMSAIETVVRTKMREYSTNVGMLTVLVGHLT